MTSEKQNWDSVKAEYLRRMEKALSSVEHPNKQEIVEDVRCHLENRFSELKPGQQTWENFQAIITEMGPASDYAELLSGESISAGQKAWRKYVLPIGLVAIALAVIVAVAILLQMGGEPQAVNPANAIAEGFEFDDIVLKSAESTKDSVRAKIGRPEKETDNLLDYRDQYGLDFFFGGGSVLSEIRLNKGFKGMLDSGILLSSALEDVFRVYGEPVSQRTVDDLHRKNDNRILYKKGHVSRIYYGRKGLAFRFDLGRVSQIVLFEGRMKSAGPGDGTYIVTFRPAASFSPGRPESCLMLLTGIIPGARTHHYRTEVKDNSLIGRICVDRRAGVDAVVSMLKEADKLELIEINPGTPENLEKLYEMGQPSLSGPRTQQKYRPLTESPNRKLLDAKTMQQLRGHEKATAGWFKIEEEYEAASADEKKQMIERWMADASGDNFEKMTRAIAALGDVSAQDSVPLLIGIAQKPKRGNRPRWMAARALGRIGSKAAVPVLINLLDHYNSDTRLYAKVALCEITGVYFADSKEKWSAWAAEQGIEVPQMDVGQKQGSVRQSTQRSSRQPSARGPTVSRTGTWADGTCSIYGHIYRRAGYSRIGHGKICLSSEEGDLWVVELEGHGSFDFRSISPGTYTLQTMDIFGYQDIYYNPANQSVEKPTFQLEEGQRQSVQLEIKPARPYRRVKGRVLGEDGKPITDHKGLSVSAWTQRPQGRWKGYYRNITSSGVSEDGSYLLDELDGRPVYVQVRDYHAQQKDNPYPPRFHPAAFSRKDAKLITFGDEDVIENIDITMQKSGGLVLQGTVTNKSTGEPVTQALVSIFHFDMFFDLFCAYTDEQGHYRIEGLGEGKFIVHVDAVHKRLVKTRKLVDIKPDKKETEVDFALTVGVDIAGKFTDEQGNEYQVGRSYGGASSGDSGFGGAASNFRYGNRYAPEHIRNASTVFYEEGEGDNRGSVMAFPTESTFLLPGILPGKTTLRFSPRGRGERVLRMMYQENDISKTGLITEPGRQIEGVTIVIGTP